MSNLPRSDSFTVGPVILSYVGSLFEARAVNNGEPKFGCNILFDETVRQQIDAQVEVIGRQAFPQEWDVPKRCKRPVRLLAEKSNYTEQQDKLPGIGYFANISSKFEPQVVDPNRQPIINVVDPTTGKKPLYGGCTGYVFINVYA